MSCCSPPSPHLESLGEGKHTPGGSPNSTVTRTLVFSSSIFELQSTLSVPAILSYLGAVDMKILDQCRRAFYHNFSQSSASQGSDLKAPLTRALGLLQMRWRCCTERGDGTGCGRS
jgi:hypothetical protein